MRQILLLGCALFIAFSNQAQDISVRVKQVSFSAADPDGAGPATGSVTFKFELKSSLAEVLADGFGLSVAYQSASLMATPTNTVTKQGPINTALWSQQVDNRAGNPISPVSYGGKQFDRRMIITFNQNAGVPDAAIGTNWTEVARLTYYTLGAGSPQGGFVVPEPATVVAQNELSSDGGLYTYPYLSPEAETPLALGASASPLPVNFVRFEAQCSPGGNNLAWSTAYEKDNAYFDIERGNHGNDWKAIGRVKGGGNSHNLRTYQFTDAAGGTAFYRIKQVDQDGTVAYSAVVRTNCSAAPYITGLYPVPARDRLALVIHSETAAKILLYVADNSGRTVMTVPVTITKGVNNIPLKIGQLSQGHYYLQSREEGFRISQRFTIAR